MIYITVISPYLSLDDRDSIKSLLKVLTYTNNWIEKHIPFKLIKYHNNILSIRNLSESVRVLNRLPETSLIYNKMFRQVYKTFSINIGNYFIEEKENAFCRVSSVAVQFIFKLSIGETKIITEIDNRHAY